MSKLALYGGKPVVERLPQFDTIGEEEARAAYNATGKGYPLSGYLGGQSGGGYYVEFLEKAWVEKFGVKHAVSCNSATSGILIACMAIGVKGKTIRTTPYTMSGTVAPASLLGANIVFGDIEPDTYCLVKAKDACEGSSIITITVNLFGHPAELGLGTIIEDASQSILASRNGRMAGDAAITVFSGNVHKQVQCGEGGMCVTNDDGIAHNMRMARNHWELAGYPAVGLNLRLSEVHAAIWYEQLKKADKIIARRIEIAEQLSEMAKYLGQVPVVKPGCKHSYYIWGLKSPRAHWAAMALKAEGIPVQCGYVAPLYLLPAFKQPIKRKIVEETNDNILIYENCAWDPASMHLKQMAEAFKKVTDTQRKNNTCGIDFWEGTTI